MTEKSSMRRAYALLSPADKRRGAFAMVFSILGALTSAGMVWSVVPFLNVLADPEVIREPGFLQTLYTALGQPDPIQFLVLLGGLTIAVVILANVVQIIRTYASARFTSIQRHSLGRQLLATYLSQPYEFFLERHTSGLSANIISEADVVVREFYRPAIDLFSAVLTTIAVTAVLASINLAVAVTAALALGCTYGISYAYVRKQLRKAGHVRSVANQKRFQSASESLQSIKDVKVLGREQAYLARFEAPSQEVSNATILIRLVSEIPRFVLQGVAFAGMIVFCLVALSPDDFNDGRALSGLAPLLGVFAFAGQRLIPEIQRIFSSLTTLQFGKAAVDRLYNDLHGLNASKTEITSTERLCLTKDVQFDRVSYAYPGSTVAGVFDVNITIKASEKIGVVGMSGSGKTTFGDLLLGLLEPASGTIVIDGTVVTTANRRAWQDSLGFVPQDIFLADASVAENIALGIPREAVDMERVRQSAGLANIDDFITENLPEGYETYVGERGVRLSGGQRQRLAIARALYQNADLIVFDEATSALDNQTETDVMAALEALPDEKTIVIIAHRLSTLELCDRILVLENGRVVGFAPQAQLMQNCRAFQDLASAST